MYLHEHFSNGRGSDALGLETPVYVCKYHFIFQNLDGDTMPRKLDYTIRMKELFLTALTKPLDGDEKPHEGFGLFFYLF